MSFPDYGTSIGEEIARALAGERDYGPDVMQLLYVANRYERKAGSAALARRRADPRLRSLHGVERRLRRSAWASTRRGSTDMQRFLPPAALTILLDIAPETAVQRKAVDRDRYERDLALQARVRESYRRQAARRRAGSCSTASAPKDDDRRRRRSAPVARHDSGSP